MIDKIVIFYGAKKDFNKVVKNNTKGVEVLPFMDLIQEYNTRLRPSESGIKAEVLRQRVKVQACVVEADDYGSVLDHVLPNFVNIVCLHHDIELLYLQNPPKRVLKSLQAYDAIHEGTSLKIIGSKYKRLSRKVLKRIYDKVNEEILGQYNCKKKVISGLYRLMNIKNTKPSVLLFYGPSGVGKTETAKVISKCLGGDLLRVQFSMMQTNEAYNYVYGAEHTHSALAKDLLGRESDIVLIDEFDKVNSAFYNAFYELFDEGIYEDSNYIANCKNTIFILTSNFSSEDEVKKNLGPAMYSRIGCCIKFEKIGEFEKRVIAEKHYKKIVANLYHGDKEIIENSSIKSWFLNNVVRYDNIRTMKNRMENAIYDELTEKLIL